MSKRNEHIITIIIIVGLILALCCAVVYYTIYLTETDNFYENVKFSVVDEEIFITYQGMNYYRDKFDFFESTKVHGVPVERDILLGWDRRGFYRSYFYSYTVDYPIYIYDNGLGWLYLREDYEYMSDLFILEGTGSRIAFSNIIIEDELNYDPLKAYKNKTNIVLYSELYPNLRASLQLFMDEDIWYVKGGSSYACAISNQFVDLLIENGIIEDK